MKSGMRGKLPSDVEVTNVSGEGFWVFLDDRERFLSFDHFPWFRDASIAVLCNVERPRRGHLYWPDLDVALTTETIDHPGRGALVGRVPVELRGQQRKQPARAKARPKPSRRRARG